MKKLILTSGEQTLLAVLFKSSKKNITRELVEKEAEYWKLENHPELINSLLKKSMLKEFNGEFVFTEAGLKEGENYNSEFMKQGFDESFLTHYKSKAYRKFCREVYGTDMFLYSMINKNQIDKLEEAAEFKNTDKVLDIGCGPGELLEYLYDKYKFNAAGIDFAPGTIQSANERVKDKSGIKYIEMDIRNLNRLEEKFTKIIAVDSLYFNKDKEKTVSHITGLLGENGSAFIFYTDLIDSGKKKFSEILDSLNLNYRKNDFTADEKNHWIKTKAIAEKYKQEFENENNLKIYEERISEAEDVMKRDYERYLYVIKKNN